MSEEDIALDDNSKPAAVVVNKSPAVSAVVSRCNNDESDRAVTMDCAKGKTKAKKVNPPEHWPKNKKGKTLPLAPKHGFYKPDSSAVFSCSSEYIQFTLVGQPQSKKRYEYSPHGHTYNRSQKEEEDVAVSIAALCDSVRGSAFFFEHKIPLRLEAKFIFSSDNSIFGRPRPDLDNLCKLVMDALNTIVYKDDNQFVDLEAKKRISKNRPNRTVVTISKFTGSLEDDENE